MVQDKKAFDFVKISEFSPKPRQHGIIEIRGPYYTAVTISYLQELLDMWGDYIDGFKFAGGSQRLLSVEILKKIINICHNHNVYVSTGGFVEKVIVQGTELLHLRPAPSVELTLFLITSTLFTVLIINIPSRCTTTVSLTPRLWQRIKLFLIL
ncbi:MAG: phosphosulfolactate synthase [Candidatus Nitrosopolaris sp.]